MWSCHLISKFGISGICAVSYIFALCMLASCASSPTSYEEQVMNGTITYPFVGQDRPIGTNGPAEKFVVKSVVGDREYVVEIPDAAKDYDVQIPLAAFDDPGSIGHKLAGGTKGVNNPQLTDREIVAEMPQLEKKHPSDTALLDKAFGVGPKDGPKQAPSYSLGLAKINEYYKQKQFELALIEINNLLSFYPTSIQLLKMKGTVHVKMQDLVLGERAWSKALELSPGDALLRRGLDRLRNRIQITKKASENPIKSVNPEYQDPQLNVGH